MSSKLSPEQQRKVDDAIQNRTPPSADAQVWRMSERQERLLREKGVPTREMDNTKSYEEF